jgi:hypothetical protein
VLPYDTSIYGNNSGDVTLVAYGEDTDPDNQHCRYALELDAHGHVFHFPAVIHGRLRDNEITGVRSFFTAVRNQLIPKKSAFELYATAGDGNPPIPRRLYHLVGSYDGETMRFYVNGKLSNVMRVSGHIVGFKPTNGLGIGGEFTDVNPVFHGRISEVAVYDRTLSSDRIRKHYASGMRGTGTTLAR